MITAQNTTRFEDRIALQEKHFNRGWCVKLCKEGEGYAVRLAQFNGEVFSNFRFDLKKAEEIFNSTVKAIGHK